MGDKKTAMSDWRWWVALPVTLPTVAAIRLTDWLGQGLHRVAFRVWGWVFRGAQ